MNKAGFKKTGEAGRILFFTGSVQAVNTLFNTELGLYRDTNGVTFIAPAYDLQVPSQLGIENVMGLHTKPKAKHKGPILSPEAQAKTSFGINQAYAGTFLPNNSLFLRAMYNIPAALTGVGQTLGLNSEPFDPNDIALFWKSQGYTTPIPTITSISVNGNSTTLVPGHADTETTADITIALSIAPQLKEIRAYMAGTDSYLAFNQAAIENKVQAMSDSFYGENYSETLTLNTVLIQMAAQGQSNFAGSGDDGSAGWGDPEDQPYITSVGGTLKGNGYVNGVVTAVYPGEGAWPNSGGGISPIWPIPSYQKAAAALNKQASQTIRNYPDVSAYAGSNYLPKYFMYLNGQTSGAWGGTSLASPLWAAFICLANQNNAAHGLKNIGFLNPIIYEIGASPAYQTAFHDIADGVNNSQPIGGGKNSEGFVAVAGYDMITGWGSMNGANLIQTLESYLSPIGTTLRMVAGGKPVVDSSGNSWTIDSGYSSTTWKNTGTQSTTSTITNTTSPALYQYSRYAPDLTYNLPVLNGTYLVTLKFAETYFSKPKERMFSVTLNGTTVISSLDIFAQAGGKNVALDEIFPVTVLNGSIVITMTATANNAQVNAIQILPMPAAP
jgi:subtilase family serine protease